ncbi:MAG TPA: CYTH domain-containing protein, partial [Nitrososphaeraceae archaeon]|nr:CYTH domain-containing protein [Nitrososphaeraceae archaeon]
MLEVEAAFLILTKDQDQVFSIISELITNKGYNYNKNGIRIIHDTYFDTKNNLLKQTGMALRIRNINEHFFKITLKILENSTEHYSKRIEIED